MPGLASRRGGQGGRGRRDPEQAAGTGLTRRPAPPSLPRFPRPSGASPAPPPPSSFLTILLRAGLGLGADSGSPRAGQLLLVVRRRRWRGLSPSIGAELGSSGGLGGEKPGEDNAPGAKGRAGRGERRWLDSAPGPSAGSGLSPAALSHNCATRPAESCGAAASARTAPGRRGTPGRCCAPARPGTACRAAAASGRGRGARALHTRRGEREPRGGPRSILTKWKRLPGGRRLCPPCAVGEAQTEETL